MTDELLLRAVTSKEIGIHLSDFAELRDTAVGGRILLVDDRASSYDRVAKVLRGEHHVDIEVNPGSALFRAAEDRHDLLIISLAFEQYDALRLCGQVRSIERTRNIPILAIADADNSSRLLRSLEIGVNDYLVRPVEKHELLARVRTQLRRKRYTERLRDNVQLSIEMAISDPLTGLYNRRYLESHLVTLLDQATKRGTPLCVLMLDIDFFKSVNDTFGHDAGDEVLKEFATRIKKSIRGIDLASRLGGEEFVIVMPETDLAIATMVGERLCRRVASDPFALDQGRQRVELTTSVGVAALKSDDTVTSVIKRADQALYRAKRGGRNRVVPDSAPWEATKSA
jgi:two-component system cell cycle response regulator